MKIKNLYKKQGFNNWKSIWLLIGFMILVASFGRLWGVQEEKSKQMDYFKQKFEETSIKIEELSNENGKLQKENEALKTKTPTSALPDTTFQTLVQMLFPTKQAQERYIKIVTTCENSTREPFRTNTNKDGSIDVGVSQINEKWHGERVEGMFGEPFYKAMTDSVKNIVYAAWLYRNDGNFHQWACDKLI